MEVLLNCGKRDTSALDLRCTGDRGYHEKIDIMALGLKTQQDMYDYPHIDKDTKSKRDLEPFPKATQKNSKSKIHLSLYITSHNIFTTNSSQSKNEKNSGFFPYFQCLIFSICILTKMPIFSPTFNLFQISNLI